MEVDFYAIDFETANESLDSACSVGIVGVKKYMKNICIFIHTKTLANIIL